MDEFKTQVLLLHSEQSTLDKLRSGFTENYTVHCATSGSEALNTLVETPINVIVTAQELPGMSGLEALREAKKRSPDTLGILLAGGADSGLEALVGDKEVFQIVRGNVTNDAVLKLVEQATQQVRLLALAESANDTAANPDEPAAQHIVMETSDNGSPIVSDGTGQLPTLDPQKVSAAASVGSQAVDVLVLTKDEEFLETIKDSSRGMHKVFYTNTLAQADEAIRKHQIGVAVVDSAMVGEKIEKLTQHLRKNSPRLVSIVAGRRDDGEMLMDLINRGKVYRFLLKPVSPGRARLAVEASVKHHLEAPDATFAPKSGDSSVTQTAPRAKPAAVPRTARQKPVAKPAPKPVPVKSNKSAPKAVQPATKPTPAPTTKAAVDSPADVAPTTDPDQSSDADIETGDELTSTLSDAFGVDDNRFVETVSGLLNRDTPTSKAQTDDASTDNFAAPDAISSSPFDLSSGDSFSKNPKMIGIAAGVLAVVAAGIFWFMSDSSNPETTTGRDSELADAAGSDSDIAATPEQPSGVDVDALLEEARLAQAAGQIFNPIENNAIALFAAAQAGAPSDAQVAAELDAVLEEALGMAEIAMLENRLDDANDALARVNEYSENNARLPFLSAQLLQTQSRSYLDQARAAIRENRFEDASTAIAAARDLGLPDATDLGLVERELGNALSAQATGDVLAKANDRLASGNLLSPANDNARYYFGLVLTNDAGNTAAQQGLSIIASKLSLQARAEIDNGNLSAAETLLSSARATDASNGDIGMTTKVLADTRAAIAARQRQAAAAAKLAEAERLADLERQAALEREAEEERLRLAAIEAVPEKQAAVLESNSIAGEATDADDTAANGLADNAAGKPGVAEVQPDKATPKPNVEKLVPVSSLSRKRYVAPRYPRGAQRRGVSGWVDVVFTVRLDGTTKDVTVKNSEPGDTFVNSAIKAVEKWEFDPVIENGVIVERRAGVRMMFAFED